MRRKQFEDEYRAIRDQLLQKEVEAAHAKSAQEVAEARASLEPLLRNEAWLNNIVRIAHLGAWDWDLEKGTQAWSDEGFRILGLRPGAIQSSYETFLNAICPDDRNGVVQTIEHALTCEPRFQIDFRAVWPNGEMRYGICQGEIYRDEADRAVRVVGTMLDLTERKRAEEEVRRLNVELEQRVAERTAQLERTNKEPEAFTYAVSHDLRAPLRHIHGFSDLLQRETVSVLTEKGRHFLDRILASTVGMEGLLEALLQLSRFGRQALHRQEVSLDGVVQEVIHDLAPDTTNRRIEWKVNHLPQADCDPTLVKIIFTNLLANSVKYTRPRTIAKIEVGQDSPRGEAIFFVRDNGVGFDMKYAERLFGVFQRLHDEKEFEGTGIGLATVKRIVEKHGGRIWAEGESGRGATFYFTLGTSERIQTSPRESACLVR